MFIKKLIYSSILIAFISTFFAGCIGILGPKPGIYINEFLTSNNGVVTDPLNHRYVDWIELYNSYDSPQSLSGFYLTDNSEDTTKWTIPAGTIMAAKSYLIVWADRKDTLFHTNYKLKRSEGQIALFSKEKKLLDHIDYKDQEVNVSYGREWDGVEQWVYFEKPTPGYSNTLQEGVEKLKFTEEPDFSLDAGFYDTDQTLSLSSPTYDVEIRYTRNGSIPTRASTLYKRPLKIDKTSVVRAIAIEEEKLASKVITRTYFINVDKDLPVISLVSDSVALWDTVTGIYEKSIKGDVRLANVEFFEDQKQVINQYVNMSISGNVARFHGQKAILLEANEKYGKGTMDHRFFPDKRIYSFQSILLRAGGHPDKYNTMFRDGMVQYLAEEHTDVDYLALRPAIVYLNGQYWGIYNIREKLNSNYFVDNYNLDKNQFDLLENSWAVANNGDNLHYLSTREFIKECDKTDPWNYAYVKTLMDVDNYIDYNICEIYAANIDWPNWNIKFWREKQEDALWKWILVDLDYGLGAGAKVDYNMMEYAASPVKLRVTNPPSATVVFRKMLEFPEFRNDFIQRFATSLNVIYSSERVLGIIKKFEDQRSKEMPLQIDRWAYSVYKSPWGKFKIPPSMTVWDEKIEVMRDFAIKRPDFVRKNIMEKFHIKGMVDITTNSVGGHIAINIIELTEGELEGSYFKGIPMKLEAIPYPGQKFLYWIVNGKKNRTKILTFNPVALGTIEAIFDKDSQTKLPCSITTNTTLIKSKSPYYATCDVAINKGVTLTVEKGVQILMEKHHSILVYGGLTCNGTKEEPVSIIPNPYTRTTEWGALCVDNATFKVELNHVNLLGGTWYDDKPKYKATITSLHSNIVLDNVVVESSFFPFYSEYGTVSISNSRLTSPKTCDLINIKYATSALVENCELQGNNYPDTDAIDYDKIDNGVIRNNDIYGFFGFNSDAIDIGEASSKVLIEGNRIFNITDKGVSIGQGSSAIIQNNLFYGCNMGVGIKDSNSFAYIDQNTFYGNRYGVAVFEKNQFAGGGSAEVLNCIFSQSRRDPILVDAFSGINVGYSISDTKELDGKENIYGDSGFEDAINFNFNLKENSPARDTGMNENQDLGANIHVARHDVPDIIINEINCTPVRKNSSLVWIELYNNSDTDVDLTGWTIKNDNHNIYALPRGFILKQNEYIVLTDNRFKFSWHYPNVTNVRAVLGKKIMAKRNILLLYDARMNLVDYVDYRNMMLWPAKYEKTGAALELKSPSLDNGDEDNWIGGEHRPGTPGVKNNVR